MTVQSSANIAGYDVTTTSYGATLNLRLNMRTIARNNNNNYFRGTPVIYPDITLSHTRTESESLNSTNPLNEVRDRTTAYITYRPAAGFDLTADGSLEDYQNRINGGTYDSRSANIASNIKVSPDADLRLSGRLTERNVQNITGYASFDRRQEYNAALEFKEQDGWSHSYRYNFNDSEYASSSLRTQKTTARVIYRTDIGLRFQGGLGYTLSDYNKKPNPPIDPIGDSSTYEAGDIIAGVAYNGRYVPDFIGPIILNTSYDLNPGLSRLTSETGGPEGSGWYYANILDLGISSDGWGKESLTLGYSFNNRRDDSAVNNDIRQEAYRFVVSTTRIERTSIRGTVTYTSVRSSNEAGSIFITTPAFYNQAGQNQKRRSYTYDLTADHTVSAFLTLAAGASRGQSTVSTYTLSTLTPLTTTDDELYYAIANFNYPLTRNLVYRAQLREEIRNTLTGDTRSHQVNMYLDYRIRQVFINLEYRWRQDIPDEGLRTMQQFFFAKISRPF